MNKTNLVEILKNCPKGTKLYSTVHGEVKFNHIEIDSEYPYPIRVTVLSKPGLYYNILLTKYGTLLNDYPNGECILFPSKEQRDWSRFTAPWLKKERFDPKTLNVFDKVLVKISNETFNTWYADFVAEPSHVKNETPLILGAKEANIVIPYNDETKHLVGTNEEAPEYYRYWEN